MFNPFKRSTSSPKKLQPQAKAPAKQVERPAPPRQGHHDLPAPEAAPLPEVVEGNEHTDWALWEDSVNVLDSQMQGLSPSARIYERDKQTPSEYQELDPFSRVNKKSR